MRVPFEQLVVIQEGPSSTRQRTDKAPVKDSLIGKFVLICKGPAKMKRGYVRDVGKDILVATGQQGILHRCTREQLVVE